MKETHISDRAAFEKASMIVGKDAFLSMDSFRTRRNNNLLVVGPSGSGKTRSLLLPNLLQADSNAIVFETKGAVHPLVGPILAEAGYEVLHMDLSEWSYSVGFDPLTFVRRDLISGGTYDSDVLALAKAVCPAEGVDDAFWASAAANLLSILIDYDFEVSNTPNFTEVLELVEGLGAGETLAKLESFSTSHKDSAAAHAYGRFKETKESEKNFASIVAVLCEKLAPWAKSQVRDLMRFPNQLKPVEFAKDRKIALFVNLPDCDRAVASVADVFGSQLLQGLIRAADLTPDGWLPRPLRIFFDDCANISFQGLPDVLAVARSREIYLGMFVQSIADLIACYGEAGAMRIVANCDVQVVLGGIQDVITASLFSKRLGKPPSSLMASKAESQWLMTRGERARRIEPYSLNDHPNYKRLAAPMKLKALEDDLAPYLADPSKVYTIPVLPDIPDEVPV